MDITDYISGLKTGDRKIIESIYQKHLGQLNSWILKNNGTEDDALDIFQEGIEAIIHKIYNNSLPDKLNFGGYLFTICKNKWYDKLKEKGKEEMVRKEQLIRYESIADNVELMDTDQNSILQTMLHDTFQFLSPTCRKLVGLLESGLTSTEVAKEMQMSNANTVYRRKFACYESWKKHLMSHKAYSLWKP